MVCNFHPSHLKCLLVADTLECRSYEHIGIGRIAIILGMINGGLGLQLAGIASSYMIAYGVCAGVMGLLYIASIVYGEMKRKRNVPPAYEDSQRMQSRELRSHDGSPSGQEYYAKEGRQGT